MLPLMLGARCGLYMPWQSWHLAWPSCPGFHPVGFGGSKRKHFFLRTKSREYTEQAEFLSFLFFTVYSKISLAPKYLFVVGIIHLRTN